MFEHYANVFDTVEINNTFHRFLTTVHLISCLHGWKLDRDRLEYFLQALESDD